MDCMLKFCIIDMDYVMHGSYNLTSTANNNDETLATALDYELVIKFAKEFRNYIMVFIFKQRKIRSCKDNNNSQKERNMNKNTSKDSRKRDGEGLVVGMSIGLSIGCAVGVATHNIGLWMPICMCIGMGAGVILGSISKEGENENLEDKK